MAMPAWDIGRCVALVLLAGTVMAQEVVTAQLDRVGESGVSGTATLIAAGDGTQVTLDIILARGSLGE